MNEKKINFMETYQLRQAVWEITYRCNMRCKHCGSGCGMPLDDELTTEEALNLCDDLGSLKLRLLTLSGGEPFMRPDWPILAKRLRENGIRVNAISNGWFIDNQLISKAKESGIVNIGVSIDGLEATHDFLRRKGSFNRSMASLELMKNSCMPTVACTTVNRKNLKELSSLKNFLIDRNVEQWQLQLGMPMGNLLHYPELILSPDDLVELIDFCHNTMKEGRIIICLADCIGYYSLKDVEIRKYSSKGSDGIWQGCPAGKRVVGIRADGCITGCLSIRDDNFIEGNIRQTPLPEIWNRPDAFAWNRDLSKDKLTGFCGSCQYGSKCLGGCSGSKITMHNCVTRNEHCLFKVTVDRVAEDADKINDVDELLTSSHKYISSKDYQFADVFLRRALELQPFNMEVIGLLGFVNYFMKNYDVSLQFNKIALDVNLEDPYVLEGYGLCLEKLGRLNEAIKYLKSSIKFAPKDFDEPYYDLAVVLDNHGRSSEALAILKSRRTGSDEFRVKSEKLFRQIKFRREEVNDLW
jgi:radical SAM protein with 4Fe4S-binding SPASM domain